MKAFIKIIAFFYFTILSYLFFFARRRRGPTLPWHHRPLNLKPLKEKIQYYTSHHHFTDSEKWNFYTDFLGNIALFIPLAFFLVFAFNIKSERRILLIIFLTSVSVELLQFLFSVGVADIDDVILNTLGGIIGIGFVRACNKYIVEHPGGVT